MRSFGTFIGLASAVTILTAVLDGTALAQSDAVYLVTYVELMPDAAAAGAALLKRYRGESRTQSGNLRLDVLAEIKRPNRFAIIEVWRDKASRDAHDRSATSAQFSEHLKPLEDAPDDVRTVHALYLGSSKSENQPGAIYVVTHIDVVPPGKEACMTALKAMSSDTANDPGSFGYDVLQQDDHSNHFTVVEEWADMKATDAHAMAAHTRAFREKLIPIKGALYDERFAMGQATRVWHLRRFPRQPTRCSMSQPNDSKKSATPLEQDNTMIAVIEMGQASWLVAGIVPGLERQPLKKLGSDERALIQLLQRWRNEAVQAGRTIKRLVVAYEAGRDGFWLARWLRARDIEAYVIHPNSVAVSREHRRAKTDRLDTELLKRAFLGWLRGEAGHCSMAAIPTIEEEDARRPNRERENLVGERTRIGNRMKATLARFGIRSFKFTLRHADERLNDVRTAEAASLPANTHAELRRDLARLRVVRDQIKEIEQQRLQRIEQAAPSEKGSHAMVRLLARVIGIGVETADMLVNEILSRQLRDRKAIARYAGLTGSPDESGKRRREKGLSRAGNARVRRGMIQLAWRFLMFQKNSALAQWYRARTADGRGGARKTMIVALARKLLIALWRMVTTGEIPEGIALRPTVA